MFTTALLRLNQYVPLPSVGPLKVPVSSQTLNPYELPPQSDRLAQNSIYVNCAQGLLGVRRGRVDVLELELLDVGQAEE